ncbi:hypothetical protein LTS08_006673 [Lithohypha guttulata]|uniref:uncharacterized protein n=1 Tax=Lithohypha guttulata TaxID=1690604 RepID=UPI002DDE7450|nr:hypothetical protein LTR51_008050 [Lithohypha guttulata]KAK5097918.1 hypothetical protein LTS08_006673 [Lithohypha guttulata]
MNDLRRRPESSAKRLSIIDPSTVRLSFTGSISDISTPITVPLEEGLQKLYQVYENNVENPIPLPKSVQITNIPLSTIADSLARRFQEQHAALLDCASQLQYINQQLQLSKQDLNNMECLYSVAVQEANRRALSSDALHLRLEWQKEEITRIDAEKEDALKKVEQQKGENTRLQGEVETLNDFVEENEMLRQKNEELERRQRYLEGEVEEMRARLERSDHVLRSVPSPVQKMCARLLVPREGQYGEYKRRKDKGRDRKRSGYLIDDAPLPPLQFY